MRRYVQRAVASPTQSLASNTPASNTCARAREPSTESQRGGLDASPPPFLKALSPPLLNCRPPFPKSALCNTDSTTYRPSPSQRPPPLSNRRLPLPSFALSTRTHARPPESTPPTESSQNIASGPSRSKVHRSQDAPGLVGRVGGALGRRETNAGEIDAVLSPPAHL
ncbi:hypothetical protein FA13DRAFT_364910 [Coprinellus micaceus]|uniref:Uncharacterized protein n=1 Tax=Coprinellus micaceus TaxID=71717 RepID=A0A4Y7TBR0_COPMI|nr:hypothetical protein FA13DRAFT_364910 [Coprinellus micaceus]